MNKREWLVSQGLAQGTRGRFSRDAEAAWTAHLIEQGNDELVPVDSDVPDLPRDGFHLATLPPVYNIVRESNSAYTVDEQGHLIGHSNCGDCKRQIRHCECSDGPWGLSYITPRQKAYLVTA
jgi:hypothetical protein